MTQSQVTPRPWKWAGEDYRGGWGWMLLVGPNGQGIACGEGKDGGPYKHLRAFVPIDPALCKTGMLADDDSAPAFHIQEADAAYMLKAVNNHDAMQACIKKLLEVYWADGDGQDPPQFIKDAQRLATL